MDTDARAELIPIYQFLGDCVRGCSTGGRTATGSLVHAAVMRKFPWFSYSAFGFARFGDFLREGDRQGYFRYDPAPPPDRLMPTGASEDRTCGPTSAESIRFVRSDFWHAFVRDDGITRYYEPSTDAVTTTYTATCILIEPLSGEEQKRWFREFSEQVLGSDKCDFVEDSLRSPTWFVDVLTPGVLAYKDISAWKRYRLRNIRTHIEAWKTRHSLAINIDQPPPKSFAASFCSPYPVIRDEEADRTRKMILEAITRMPTAELMRLAIPLIYFEGRALAQGFCNSRE